MDILQKPWPWYVAGPLIGLTVPLLLILGNRTFGLSSSLRHICAACVPGKIPFFQYNWREEAWNLFFVAGIAIGAFLTIHLLGMPETTAISAKTINELALIGLYTPTGMQPSTVFSWQSLFTWEGIVMMVVGGFLVGFGTRWGDGCTSGHAITGLSNLQWPSLVATVSFFAGGLFAVHVLFPLLF